VIYDDRRPGFNRRAGLLPSRLGTKRGAISRERLLGLVARNAPLADVDASGDAATIWHAAGGRLARDPRGGEWRGIWPVAALTTRRHLKDNQGTRHGIMALSREPIAHRDHAQRACWAALHLPDEIAWHPTTVERAHGLGGVDR
jgi:hypothetical protein